MVARNITIELDEALDKGLQRLAESTGRSPDDLVRDAVERFVLLADQSPRPLPKAAPGESVLDRLKASGVIGSIKNAPPDLLTNPKHMEGFGE